MDYLMQPITGMATSHTSFSSESSSRRSSLSSSRPDFRPIHSEIIRRNLVTDFLSSSSLPAHVPTHRSRSVTDKMVAPSSLASSGEEDKWEEEEEWRLKLQEIRSSKKSRRKEAEVLELMFLVDL
jgi:hypothetical protein